jgi:hypothetical protein
MDNDLYPIPAMLDQYVRALKAGEATFNYAVDRVGQPGRDNRCFQGSDTLRCHRMRILKVIGAVPTPPEDLSLRRFLLGDTVEAILVQAVLWACSVLPEYQGIQPTTQGTVEFPEWSTDPEHPARGHYDLFLRFPSGQSVVYDVKSCHSDKIDWVKKGERDPHYLGQVSFYRMGLQKTHGRLPDRAGIIYVDKDTMATHLEWAEDSWMDAVAHDYATLVDEYRHYLSTKEVPPELDFVTERERYPSRKRYETLGGEGKMPQWTCNPKWCGFAVHCPTVMTYWRARAIVL